MALDVAVETMSAAVRSLAGTDEPLHARVQRAWTDHVQQLWVGRYLPEPLHLRFKAMWERYTDSSADPQSATLRTMDPSDVSRAADELVALAFQTMAAHARGETPMVGSGSRG